MPFLCSSRSLLLAVGLLSEACAHSSSGAGANPPAARPELTAPFTPAEARDTSANDEAGRRALADAVAASSAVVVATARVVDDRAGLTTAPHEGGTTRLLLALEQVLVGAATPGEREIWLRGGVLPDGSILSSSEGPPDLTEGDRYILFLRDAPRGHNPFVKFHHAVLRIVRFGDQERVVDESGRGIVAARSSGLRTLGKISEAMMERRIAMERARGSGATYDSQDRLVPADIERTSLLHDVLAVIAGAAPRAPAQ